MKKQYYLILLFTLFVHAVGYTQTVNKAAITQTIKGTITDKNSKLALPGVTIKITSIEPARGTATNASGVFRMAGVPVGRHAIEVTYTGYEPIILSDVLVTGGKETELNFELVPANRQLKEVVVSHTSVRKPLNSMALSSGRSFSPEETNRYAGAFFDPARMAQSFAGVVAGGDNNEIIVRGNSPKSLQWRLEGIEIINPNHFSDNGSAGGAISMINSTVLSTSDFYTGAVPAEYNNATAGVFDLKFRKGNTDRHEYSFTAGILGVGATLEGPFSQGGQSSYLVSYRYSSLDLLMKMGVNVSDGGIPRYQDLSFNFVFPTKKAGTFSLFGLGGSGGINSKAELDFSKWKERGDGQDYDGKYSAGSFGLKNVYIANPKLYISNILSYSGDYTTSTLDTLTRTYQPSVIYKSKFSNTAIRYAGMVNYHTSDNNTIRAGANAGFLHYDMRNLNYKQELQRLDEVLNEQGDASTFDIYAEDKHDFGDFTLNTGVHSNYFNLSKSWSIEPRIGLSWQFKPDQQLSLAAGTYSRIEPLAYYFAKGFGSDAESGKLKPTRSAQMVLGYEKQFNNRLKFKSEAYYQYLYDVPVSADPTKNFSLLDVSNTDYINSSDYRALVNKGKGYNYGLELSLEKSLSKGYYFIVTSSLFDSRFKALSGLEFSTTFNTHFVGNLVAGKEWAAGHYRKNIFGLNAKVIYTGGRKYSPINVGESLKLDEEVIDQSKINSLTADAYFRVDFSASYRINGHGKAHFLLLDIQNVLNRENNIGYYYNSSKRQVELNKWIGIIPTLTYRIEL